jgi:hypothetical protein
VLVDWLLRDDDPAIHIPTGLMESLAPRSSSEFRAKQLLLRVLTPAQRDEYERYGYFTVHAAGWGRFRVMPRTTFNVVDTLTGVCYCAGPEGVVPVSDLMLAQKLVLEHDPARFFAVARSRSELQQ